MKSLPVYLTLVMLCTNCVNYPYEYEVEKEPESQYRPVLSLESIIEENAEEPMPLSDEAQGEFRTAESVGVYNVGRTPSQDRRTMREGHSLYRVQEASQWNLAPMATPIDSTGPVTDFRPVTELPLRSDEINAELAHQQEITDRLRKAEAELQRLVEQARAELAESRRSRLRTMTENNDAVEFGRDDRTEAHGESFFKTGPE